MYKLFKNNYYCYFSSQKHLCYVLPLPKKIDDHVLSKVKNYNSTKIEIQFIAVTKKLYNIIKNASIILVLPINHDKVFKLSSLFKPESIDDTLSLLTRRATIKTTTIKRRLYY